MLNNLQELLVEEIKDLYSAETQLVKAIPKMAKASHNPRLKEALLAHLEETKTQVVRLETVAGLLDIKPTGKKCKGMEGVIKEGDEATSETGEEAVLDLALISAGSRVEHYEMAGYHTAIALCRQMGATEEMAHLEKSLAEEQAAEKKLRMLAKSMLEAHQSA